MPEAGRRPSWYHRVDMSWLWKGEKCGGSLVDARRSDHAGASPMVLSSTATATSATPTHIGLVLPPASAGCSKMSYLARTLRNLRSIGLKVPL